MLRNHGDSAVACIEKDWLRRDGLLVNGEVPEGREVYTDRLGKGVYLVRAVDGDVPELEECEVIRRLVAEAVVARDDRGAAPLAD
ncbi:hypothetical protein FCF25_08985 [Haloprofundus sp. MHR1]|nr:hypothetical protein FCF25_08985 [Haloprofundus sp. MHR1]